MEWWHWVLIVLYGIGALVWLIAFILSTVEDASRLRKEEQVLQDMLEKRPGYYSQQRVASQQRDYDHAAAQATWSARMILLFPLWLPALLFVVLRQFVRVLKPFVRLVAPGLDKKAKQRKADKEKADAEARLYPTER